MLAGLPKPIGYITCPTNRSPHRLHVITNSMLSMFTGCTGTASLSLWKPSMRRSPLRLAIVAPFRRQPLREPRDVVQHVVLGPLQALDLAFPWPQRIAGLAHILLGRGDCVAQVLQRAALGLVGSAHRLVDQAPLACCEGHRQSA